MKKIMCFAIILGLTCHISSVSARLCGSYPSANGNIQIETNKVQETYNEIQTIAEEFKAVKKNYNIYTNQQTGKKQITANYLLPRESAPYFMDKVTKLKGLKSQSYNENTSYYNIADLKKKLNSYEKHLKKVLSYSAPDDEIISLLMQQINSLKSQIQNYERTAGTDSEKTASINITIAEKNYNQASSYAAMLCPQKRSLCFGAIALLCFLLGLLVNRMLPKNKKLNN